LNHFYNNYYPGGTYQTSADSINLFNSGNRTYNYYTYGNEVDHYQQNHYQLHYTHEISKKWNVNLAGHLTTGKGYFEQYRKNENFETYGLQPIVLGSDTITTTDLIRRRWLDNLFYGGIFSLNYTNLKNLKLVFGGGINKYDGTHFGEISWARYDSQSVINQHYYHNNANKTELNTYIKANYQVKKWNLYADLQLRKIDYSYLGMDQSFGNLVPLQQDISFTFFNPKVGFMYEFNSKSLVYGSISRANREPVRDDFIQSTPLNRPTSEQLDNLEIGYKYHNRKIFASVNYYLMNYKNQLILTGEINDVGAYNRTNVAKSYRMGIELEAGYLLMKNLSLTGNVSISANKIHAFNEYLDNYDNYDSNGNMIQTVIAHTNSDIAFAP
jgi:iron complex outermembrane receptor protein